MNIYQAITAAMADVEPIAKGRVNKEQRFNFRGIDEVMNELQPILKKHGLFVVPKVVDVIRQEKPTKSGGILLYSIVTMEYTMYAQDGSSITGSTVGEGMDSGDKASNKAMAVALKYFLLQTFCIPTEDAKDPDANSHTVAATPAPIDKDKLSSLAAIMNKNRKDGTPYFTEERKKHFRELARKDIDQCVKDAEIALEEFEAAE